MIAPPGILDFTDASLGGGASSRRAGRDGPAIAAAALEATRVDPLLRLLDPGFTETLWTYEHSRTEPEIPGQLHPKQIEALTSAARHRWLFWGNQVGKTSLGAIDCALLAVGRHPVQKWAPPVTIWASALTWELWENILLPELLTWIPPERVLRAPEPNRKGTNRTIWVRADNGKISKIVGKAAEQGAARYQSARVHRVWFDEEHPEAVYDEIQPRLLRHGGDTLATMTPLKGLTWVFHRVYEPHRAGKLAPEAHFCSHAGLVDNPSIKPEDIAELTSELKHNPAQLAARLYGHFVRPTGLVLPFDPDKHFEEITIPDVRANLADTRMVAYAGMDFSIWRFAFVLAVADRLGKLHIVDEVFSQREDLTARAAKVHAKLRLWGVPDTVTIAGDCANPQDIVEINAAFTRINSPYMVSAVHAENKIRIAGAMRLENMLNRGSLLVRRGIGAGMNWMLGYNASRAGKPVEGSRLVWELNNWQYPKTDDDKIQKDDPDDVSADGADEMAALRYLAMTWWQAETPEPPPRTKTWHEEIWDDALRNDQEEQRAGAHIYGDVVREG